MSAAPLLKLKDVSCIRGGRLLFERLSFDLAGGQAIVVTGANGIGKSSLIRLAAGLLEPAAGTVERGSKLALADEHLALDPRQTLKDALGFWAALDGGDPWPALKAMGLEALSAAPVRILSTGQRKRAALARAIASNAPLWLLDEPANGLDEEGRILLARAMSDHLGRGGAILSASHQPIGLAASTVIALEPA